MSRKRQSDSGSSTDTKPNSPSEKNRRRTNNKAPKVQEPYLVRYAVIDSKGLIVSEEDKMESTGDMQQVISEKVETPPLKSSIQCYISVMELPNQQENPKPMGTEIRYSDGQQHTSIPSVPYENLEIIEVPVPPIYQNPQKPPNLEQLQRLLLAVSSKHIGSRPHDFAALDCLVSHNEGLIKKHLERTFKIHPGKKIEKVEKHVKIHKQKIEKVKDLLSKVPGFTEKMAVDLYYAFHELHVEIPNDIDMLIHWIANNINLHYEIKKLNERAHSGIEKANVLKEERHHLFGYYRHRLGISLEQLGIIQNKLIFEAKNALFGQVSLKEQHLIEEGIQSAQSLQQDTPVQQLPLEQPSFQSYIPQTVLNVSLPPEFQFALGLNTFQTPTPPSTSSTLSPAVASGIPYSASRASSPPSALSAFTPIGSSAVNILSPIQAATVDQTPTVDPTSSTPLQSFDLVAELNKLNNQKRSIEEKSSYLTLEEVVIKRMKTEILKEKSEWDELDKAEEELVKKFEEVKRKQEALNKKLTRNEESKQEKERKVKKAREELGEDVESYNKRVEVFNELAKLASMFPTWSAPEQSDAAVIAPTLGEPSSVPVYPFTSTIFTTPTIPSDSSLNTSSHLFSPVGFSPVNTANPTYPSVSADLIFTPDVSTLMALVTRATQLETTSTHSTCLSFQ